ncbi:galactokinase [Spirochaetia bacterium]|nr:galactokinase [Spirochaetia bacterium]
MIISQTPFRLSFFGGGTDYAPYYKEYGGAVLSTTIDKFCYITLRHLPQFFDYTTQISYHKREEVKNVEEIEHPSVKACMKYMNLDSLSINYDADLPARTGLGSSSAFTVGLLHAMHGYKGEYIDKISLGKEAIHVEQDLIGENVGVQDQMAAACGGLNVMEFSQDDIVVRPVTLSLERKKQLSDCLLLVYTGISRFASKIAEEQIKNTPGKTLELKQMYDMVYEGEKILAGTDDIMLFGKLMNESWKIKRSLSGKISNSTIDTIYDAALKNGAVGAKLLGAGGGGFMVLFSDPEKKSALIDTLKLMSVPFAFENNGSKIIYYQP